MDLSFSYFIQEVTSNPAMMVTVLLTLGVIFVNGWTDAPNAIATCIGTRSMGVRSAIMTSAVFNFLGVLVMTHINSSVASTISAWRGSRPARRMASVSGPSTKRRSLSRRSRLPRSAARPGPKAKSET